MDEAPTKIKDEPGECQPDYRRQQILILVLPDLLLQRHVFPQGVALASLWFLPVSVTHLSSFPLHRLKRR